MEGTPNNSKESNGSYRQGEFFSRNYPDNPNIHLDHMVPNHADGHGMNPGMNPNLHPDGNPDYNAKPPKKFKPVYGVLIALLSILLIAAIALFISLQVMKKNYTAGVDAFKSRDYTKAQESFRKAAFYHNGTKLSQICAVFDVMAPGTAHTSRSASSASSAVENVPDGSPASTISTAWAKPAIRRFLSRNVYGRGAKSHGCSDTTAPPASITRWKSPRCSAG